MVVLESYRLAIWDIQTRGLQIASPHRCSTRMCDLLALYNLFIKSHLVFLFDHDDIDESAYICIGEQPHGEAHGEACERGHAFWIREPSRYSRSEQGGLQVGPVPRLVTFAEGE